MLLDKNLDSHTSKYFLQSQGETSAFEKMINSKTGRQMLNSSTMKLFIERKPCTLFSSKNTEKSESNTFDRAVLELDRLKYVLKKEDLFIFSTNSEDMFKIFHLMYEDIKLNIFNTKYIKDGDFISFLFMFCLKKGPSKFAYSEYYIREQPYVLKIYEDEYNKYREEYRKCISIAKEDMALNKTNSNYVIPAVLSEPLNKVPSIYAWIESKLHPSQYKYESNFFCFFFDSVCDP